MVAATQPSVSTETWWEFLVSERPDPRLLQVLFAACAVLDLATHAFVGSLLEVGSGPPTALALVLIATFVSFLLPWQRLPVWTTTTIPAVDLAALGLTLPGSPGNGPVVLALLPALWLGRHFGRRGAALAAVLVTLFITAPGMVLDGMSGLTISRGFLLPVVTGLVGMAVALTLEALRARDDEVQERRREAEDALAQARQEQQLNHAILDTVDVGLLLLGTDGSYRAANRFWERGARLAFPQGAAGHAGQRGRILAEDGLTPLAVEEMPTQRAARGEEFRDCRIWIGDDDTDRRALSVSACSLHDDRGEYAGAVLAYQDVTDLLGALQVKDQFMATVSHELRTPLTSIIGYVDILREREDLDAQADRQLSVVHRNGERLLRLVDDLLHTAQLAGGRAQLSLERCRLAEVVRDAVSAAQPVAAAAGVTVEAQLLEQVTANIDRERIGQVLDNLLVNAVRYNRPGGHVCVRLSRTRDEALLEVRDTGAGMAPEECEQLFTRFYRGRHAHEQAIPGAGLGLTITKAITEAHEGSIRVTSETGVGTTMRVRLPALPAEVEPEPTAAVVAEPVAPRLPA